MEKKINNKSGRGLTRAFHKFSRFYVFIAETASDAKKKIRLLQRNLLGFCFPSHAIDIVTRLTKKQQQQQH